MEHKSFIPFPAHLLEQRRRVECVTFMGILPEIMRGWLTIDNRLYIWNFSNPEEYILYEELSEVIVSVAIVPPKPGIFNNHIKYLLVVATPTIVVLLSILTSNTESSLPFKDIRLENSHYFITTDNITIYKVIGTQTGRIFMAGDDGNLYELTYEDNRDAWTTYLGLDAPYKCRKIKHFAYKLTSLVIPSFVWGIVGAEESLIDIIVDDTLNLLYTVSSTGSLGVFYLGISGNETHQIVPNFSSLFNYNLISAARDFITTSNGRGMPDMALFQEPNLIRVVGVFVVPVTESKAIQLVAILSCAVRVYLSVLSESGLVYNPGSGNTPSYIVVTHVRCPPPVSVIDKLKRGEKSNVGESFAPTSPTGSLLTLHRTFYSQGVLICALGKEDESDTLIGITEDLVSRKVPESDYTLPCLRESVCIPRNKSNVFDNRLVMNNTSQNNMNQNYNIDGKIYDIKESNMFYNDYTLSYLRSLHTCSKTPKDYSILNQQTNNNSLRSFTTTLSTVANNNISRIMNDELYPSIEIVPGPSLLSPAFRPRGIGIPREELCSTNVVLGELSLQQGPPLCYPQRTFLCLTSVGLIVLGKVRPVDILYRILAMHIAGDEFMIHAQTILQKFGPLQFCAMCIGIACGIPVDGGGSAGTGLQYYTSVSASSRSVPDLVRRRAMVLALRICGQPSYKVPYQPAQPSQLNGVSTPAGSSAATTADSRIVFGAQFMFSAAHDGLVLLLSRLVRPIWLKRCVALTSSAVHIDSSNFNTVALHTLTYSSPSVTQSFSVNGSSKSTVKVLLTRNDISLLRQPLLNLQRVFKDFFSSSVARDLKMGYLTDHMNYLDGSHQSNVDSSMNVSSTLIVRELASRAVSVRDPLMEARRIEELSLNSLYRLLTRIIQALSLLDLLLTMQIDYAVIIPWNKLDGLTFHSLVTSVSAHETIRALITTILCQPSTKLSTTASDFMISQLDNYCFMYFSVGDKYAYEASKYITNALNSTRNSPECLENTRVACSLLVRAAKYWLSLSTVSGTESDLYILCKKLCSIGEMGGLGAVDLCLAAAENFGGSLVMPSADAKRHSSPNGSLSSASTAEDWERGLYHGGCVEGEQMRLDARLSCYKCILTQQQEMHSLNPLGSGFVSASASDKVSDEESIAIRHKMLLRALERSSDPLLHKEIFMYALHDDPDWLISLPSKRVEEFLNEHNPGLLYS